jgi:hypothetical protein
MVRVAQHPEPNFVLKPKKDRPEGRDHIMQRNRYHRGDRVAAQQISNAEREKRFDPEEWREADEHSNRNSPGYCVRSIPQSDQPRSEALDMVDQLSHSISDNSRPCPLPD